MAANIRGAHMPILFQSAGISADSVGATDGGGGVGEGMPTPIKKLSRSSGEDSSSSDSSIATSGAWLLARLRPPTLRKVPGAILAAMVSSRALLENTSVLVVSSSSLPAAKERKILNRLGPFDDNSSPVPASLPRTGGGSTPSSPVTTCSAGCEAASSVSPESAPSEMRSPWRTPGPLDARSRPAATGAFASAPPPVLGSDKWALASGAKMAAGVVSAAATGAGRLAPPDPGLKSSRARPRNRSNLALDKDPNRCLLKQAAIKSSAEGTGSARGPLASRAPPDPNGCFRTIKTSASSSTMSNSCLCKKNNPTATRIKIFGPSLNRTSQTRSVASNGSVLTYKQSSQL
mmetsp:Transcript_35243/g.80733  ORF Transcript_35243/g.80733 Transcript_35243/m.80733 type:complete len:347 (-) Transcript_35243:693-1733(-)